MANHPNRSTSSRAVAAKAGFFVREGEYQGTTDNRLGRWYVGRVGENFYPHGTGFSSQAQAWAAAAEEANRD